MWRFPGRFFLFGLITLLWSVSAGLSQASPRTLVMAADQAWQPFIDAEAEDGGLVVKLVTEAFAEAGRQVEMQYLSWSRVLRRAENANFDGIAGAFQSPERDGSFLFSQPILDFRVVLIGREGFELAHYGTLDELQGLTVGIVQDAAYPEAFLASDFRFHAQHSRSGLIRMLAQGRIDLLADTEALFRYHALSANLNPDDFVQLSPPLREEPLYLAVPRLLDDGEQIVEDFNRGLAQLRQSGRYLEIRRQYGY